MKTTARSLVKKTLKVLGITGGSIVSLLLIAYVVIYLNVRHRINRTYDIPDDLIEIDHDTASIARGARLVSTRACRECHGQDLGGRIIIDDFAVGRFVARNLTKGLGGLPENFAGRDWVRAMKHGVNSNARPLFLMPSHELSQLSEQDMADIIAYCAQLPNVDRELPPFRIGPLGYVLTGFDLIPLLPAEITDHTKSFAKVVEAAVSVEYGEYLSAMCINCHGRNFKGGKSPVPGGTPIADISSTGNPGKWSRQEFISALKTGRTPEGKILKPEEMPWTITQSYTDDELAALHMYLQSIP